MQIETKDKDLSALLELYNKEIDILKSKLLNGIPWEELVPVRRNIIELAIAIQKSHNYIVTDEMLLLKETPDQESLKGE